MCRSICSIITVILPCRASYMTRGFSTPCDSQPRLAKAMYLFITHPKLREYNTLRCVTQCRARMKARPLPFWIAPVSDSSVYAKMNTPLG